MAEWQGQLTSKFTWSVNRFAERTTETRRLCFSSLCIRVHFPECGRKDLAWKGWPEDKSYGSKDANGRPAVSQDTIQRRWDGQAVICEWKIGLGHARIEQL